MIESYADNQRRARRQSRALIGMFVAGVAATILSFWFILAGAMSLGADGGRHWSEAFLRWEPFVWVTGLVGFVVLSGSLRMLYRLRHGGPAIAAMLGGVEVSPDSREASERRLLNVVEEMAISSGLPMPRVYVVDCTTINAFAAGKRPESAVIGVTRGCMDRLSRDELQGVIAHEFSHIYHGDTRINARTVAAIAGIMALGTIGWVMFRIVGPAILRAEMRAPRRKDKGGGGAGLAIMVAGLLIWALGSIGVLYGRLLQAAISRRREFLADASAVDYTRNPDGIAGALRRIRDEGTASVPSGAASELNHFFFCSSLGTLFATHPPIDERIRRIVAMGATAAKEDARKASAARGRAGVGVGVGEVGFAGAAGVVPPPPPPRRRGVAAVPIYEPGSTAWLAALPAEFRERLRTPAGARAACYAIAGTGGRDHSFAARIAGRDPEAGAALAEVAEVVRGLREDRQVALVDVAGPALRAGGRAGYRSFRETLRTAIRADGDVEPREWALFQALERNVGRRLGEPTRPPRRVRLEDAPEETRAAIAACAATNPSPVATAVGFRKAYETLGLPAPALGDAALRNLSALDAAIGRLAGLDVDGKERLLSACAVAIARDGEILPAEHMLLRAIADGLDMPMPAVGE